MKAQIDFFFAEKLAIPVVSQHDNAYYFNKFFYLDVDQALPMCYDFDAPMLSELVYLPGSLSLFCRSLSQ